MDARDARKDALETHALLEPLPDGSPQTDRSIDQAVTGFIRQPSRRGWKVMLGVTGLGTAWFVFAVCYTLAVGIGAWGNNIPVGWAFGITNFVWWIGIGHAGTLISAILLLFQAQWRTSINRFAEAMTLFAVVCAGVFPLLHLGRPWFAYWLTPYPSTMGMWPNFKSPLVWDVFAVSTYLTVSFLFWYLGLLPDLATLRDGTSSRLKRIVYGIFALGWRGSARHYHHYQQAYLLLAGLATPLVLSVHTIVSFDFAVGIVPGWHSTIFPPYFVAGAVFSGFAMVLTLMIPARRFMGLHSVITSRHLENMCKVLLLTGWFVTYGYLCEHFLAWYSGNPFEQYAFRNRQMGPYAPIYWLMIGCNCVVPNIFWSKRARTSLATIWIASILINVGMWCERFVIVVTSLHREFLPSKWEMFYPTWVDWSLLFGTMSLFGFLFLLFLRFVPAVATSEVKELRAELAHAANAAGSEAHA